MPTIHNLLLSRAGNERPAGSEGLRFIRSCSASLPPEMMAHMERVFGAPVLEGEHKTSMLQDLEAGRPMELEPVVGAVVELGE